MSSVESQLKTMTFEIIMGYRNESDSGEVLTSLTATSHALVVNGFSFRPEDVVEIRVQRDVFAPPVIVIEHILFEQLPNAVIFTPIDESCERLLEWIRTAGFKPCAEPLTPWMPPETPFPLL